MPPKEKQFTEEEARQRKNARQREYEKRTGYAARAKFVKEKARRYVIEVYKTTETDIYNKLEKQESKATYIKNLIRKDIEENGI